MKLTKIKVQSCIILAMSDIDTIPGNGTKNLVQLRQVYWVIQVIRWWEKYHPTRIDQYRVTNKNDYLDQKYWMSKEN